MKKQIASVIVLLSLITPYIAHSANQAKPKKIHQTALLLYSVQPHGQKPVVLLESHGNDTWGLPLSKKPHQNLDKTANQKTKKQRNKEPAKKPSEEKSPLEIAMQNINNKTSGIFGMPEEVRKGKNSRTPWQVQKYKDDGLAYLHKQAGTTEKLSINLEYLNKESVPTHLATVPIAEVNYINVSQINRYAGAEADPRSFRWIEEKTLIDAGAAGNWNQSNPKFQLTEQTLAVALALHLQRDRRLIRLYTEQKQP